MSSPRSRALSPRAVLAPITVLLAALMFLFAGLALAEQGPATDRFIVKFKDGKGPQGKGALRRAGAELLLELGPQNAAAVRIPAQALAGIARNPNVEYIEADPPRYPMAQTVPYGIKMVQADPADGGIAPGPDTPLVCIIDSGYETAHEDLDAGATVTGEPGGSNSWDVDYCGHGTHVAGTIAAMGNSYGVVGVIGDPAAIDLHILKVFGSPSSSCGWSYASTLVDAANQCQAAGAKIINMSLGCTGRRCASSTENTAFAALYAAGVLPIAAAGNSGNTQYSYPASYDSVVAVAAVDENGSRASFSQRNDQVELAAPGVSVLSTYNGNRYASLSGTSMAAPHVAGVAALVWSYDESLTAADVRGILQATALDLGAAGRDTSYGYGLVQAKAAVASLGGSTDPAPAPAPEPEPEPANEPPTASFTYQCVELACDFTFTGGDSDGTIAAYDWNFGDGADGNTPDPAHTYSAGGTYTVTLTVTDDDGASDSASQAVMVTEPDTGGDDSTITLAATGYKVRGAQKVDLAWSGATSTNVDIVRDGGIIATTGNDGAYTDNINRRGGGSYTYQVCEAGTSTCSAAATANF